MHGKHAPSELTAEQTAMAVRMYRDGAKLRDISSMLRCGNAKVARALRREGVELRKPGQRISYGGIKRPVDPKAAIACAPIGGLPDGHHLQAVDRVALRDREIHRRLDVMRHAVRTNLVGGLPPRGV